MMMHNLFLAALVVIATAAKGRTPMPPALARYNLALRQPHHSGGNADDRGARALHQVDRARRREDDATSAAIAISTQSDAIAIREAQGDARAPRRASAFPWGWRVRAGYPCKY